MESLLLAFRVVFPLFLLLSVGYILKLMGVADQHTFSGCNKLVFKVFLPAVLLRNIAVTSVSDSFSPRLVVYGVIATILLFFILMGVLPRLEPDRAKCSSIFQAVFRTGFILFSIAITEPLYGAQSFGTVSLLVAVIIPLSNVLAVTGMEYFRGSGINARRLFSGIIKHPLIIASLLGGLLLIFNIKLPHTVDTALFDLGKIATPLALVSLGGTFHFESVKGSLRQLVLAGVLNLIIVPLLFVVPAAFFGFSPVEMAALLSLFGSPASVSTYAMACEMDADGPLAGQIVVFNSAFSVFSLFGWISIFSFMGFM